ncbi:hypothetical protein SAMN04488691_11521 [Haloferax larsenii]|uniref:Uncharacterized protein n=1 Tax=Haloferax larsenii TaxID=302484 RepID=A0A1H7UZ95_HALLR|nr:hypothetical protein SAMN04488691_11521 [Haloferax larsenii]
MRTLQSETSLFVTDAVVKRGIDLLEWENYASRMPSSK